MSDIQDSQDIDLSILSPEERETVEDLKISAAYGDRLFELYKILAYASFPYDLWDDPANPIIFSVAGVENREDLIDSMYLVELPKKLPEEYSDYIRLATAQVSERPPELKILPAFGQFPIPKPTMHDVVLARAEIESWITKNDEALMDWAPTLLELGTKYQK